MNFINNTYSLLGTTYNSFSNFLAAVGGSYARASAATYYDAAGILQTATNNTLRFDRDPVSHAIQGVLIEGAATNLFTRSSEFDHAAWGKSSITTVANTELAPDGTNTAELVTATTTGVNQGYMSQQVTGAFITYSFSIYAKAGNVDSFKVQPNTQINGAFTGFVANFNLTSQTTATGGHYGGAFTSTSSRIQPVGNGWYRCTTTYTVTGTTYNSPLATWIYPYTAAVNGSNVILWGAQQEQNPHATSYIPTGATTVARSGDTLTMPAGAWFNQDQGTWYGQFTPNSILPSPRIIGSSSSAGTFLSISQATTGTFRIGAYDGNGAGTVNTHPQFMSAKAVGAYTSTSMSVALNGGAVASGTRSGTYPLTPATTIYIGRDLSGVQLYAGHMQDIRYYPARMSDTVLQNLTTP